jgi:hypothetical protein
LKASHDFDQAMQQPHKPSEAGQSRLRTEVTGTRIAKQTAQVRKDVPSIEVVPAVAKATDVKARKIGDASVWYKRANEASELVAAD